ncbi:major capsid protein [Serratia sarumanii]|uniref:major capsid protein n=1 Tax=Serratia sarumanii TaxID=3020826 RepID=UPI003F8145CD
MSLIIFQQQVSTAATELVDQEVQKFNAASGGALVMGNDDHIGDFIEQTSWQLIGGLAQRRNAYGSGNLTPEELGQILDRMVKVDGRIGPVSVTPTMMKRLGKDVAEASSVVAAQAAEAMIQDFLNTACGALKTAISTNSKMVTDLSGAAGSPVQPSLRGLNKGVRPMGDTFSRILAWVMDGATYNDFIDEALANPNRLFQIGNVNVMQDGLGRRFVISDVPSLADGNLQHALGLTAAAAAVKTTPLIMKAQDVLGQENLKALMQGEYDFTIGLKGYKWKNDNIKSPTNDQLTAAANWQKTATSDKDTAGVMVTFGEKAAAKAAG